MDELDELLKLGGQIHSMDELVDRKTAQLTKLKKELLEHSRESTQVPLGVRHIVSFHLCLFADELNKTACVKLFI